MWVGGAEVGGVAGLNNKATHNHVSATNPLTCACNEISSPSKNQNKNITRSSKIDFLQKVNETFLAQQGYHRQSSSILDGMAPYTSHLHQWLASDIPLLVVNSRSLLGCPNPNLSRDGRWSTPQCNMVMSHSDERERGMEHPTCIYTLSTSHAAMDFMLRYIYIYIYIHIYIQRTAHDISVLSRWWQATAFMLTCAIPMTHNHDAGRD